ncbi:MAG TPA: phosphoenolpyruvate carboxylase, partial [Alphaproteobacteria bacterium]|nr:phosphoenolpyruvate carboxylase [Alphaproteobacteria bacterium]
DGTAARPVPFETFREAVERFHYGFVLTAHPTFSLNADQNRALSDLAWAIAEERDCTQPRHALWETLRTPFVPPDLDTENAQALEAARRIREAVGTLRQIALEVAARHYPLEWTALRPTLCSVATWVGFDLDGRSDIVWSGILARRLLLQTLQIEELIRHLDTLPSLIQAARSPVAQAQACLNTALDQARGLRDLFASYDPDRDPDHAALQASSRAMIANASARMIRPDRVVALLEEALALEPSPAGQMGLVGVLSALRAEGGAFAQVHFRVNAVQIHNAIRKHVDLTTHPADPRFRQTYLERIGRLLAGARPCPVHFGTILEEQASARRLFMIVQQIVKHVDAASPIRFLIAETESALTVLGALYLARRFGVEDHVDLCPLFETERALEDGAHIVQTLLESPDFVAWVRQRGRLCIQTGYSDAGRYIGQIPACGTIERLKARIVHLMAARGLTDIDLVFFDTHGESIGRGGYPGSFAQRLDYISPPALRALAAREGVRLVQETSYQGGDGYLPFLNPDAARAAVTRVMTHILTPHEPGQAEPIDDPYYEESGAITGFLTLIRQFQGELIDDPDYGALLSVFGPNLMRAAGSRALKRQHEGPRGVDRLLEARELRAIPHNAILAQMGVLVNSACGLGTAVSEDPDLFRRMTGRSDRFRALSAMGLRARAMSDTGTLRAYILTLDPDLWLARQDSCARTDPAQAERHGAIAAHLEAHSPFVGLHRVFRMIRADFNALAPAVPEGEHTPLCESLSLLHALRIGLILRIFSLAMDIPDYSRMHDIPREALIQKVFRLDVPAVMRELDEIFPVHPRQETRADYGEPSGWSGEEKESYAVEHARIFRPIARLYEMVQDTSAAIAHHIGFVG